MNYSTKLGFYILSQHLITDLRKQFNYVRSFISLHDLMAMGSEIFSFGKIYTLCSRKEINTDIVYVLMTCLERTVLLTKR